MTDDEIRRRLYDAAADIQQDYAGMPDVDLVKVTIQDGKPYRLATLLIRLPYAAQPEEPE